MQYVGRLVRCTMNRSFAFVKLSSVTKIDGSAHELETAEDIFIHKDDLDEDAGPLLDDRQIMFEVVPDGRRPGALRAINANAYDSGALVALTNESRELVANTASALYVSPTENQGLHKKVSADVMKQVIFNRPMPTVSRTETAPEDSQAVTREHLERLFPKFIGLSTDSQCDMVDEAFDEVIQQALQAQNSVGMGNHVKDLSEKAALYKDMRSLLTHNEFLLKPGAILPMEYLPDLFMAVPVWYFWVDEKTRLEIEKWRKDKDPHVHPILQSFCNQVHTQRWVDTFLMFNRNVRILADYNGDIMTPHLVERTRALTPMFSHVVIMTPYHDVAGSQWGDPEWIRSIDPYIVGFRNGVPLMFVLGRFSDSGTFPLHTELVADTISFLRRNVSVLKKLNTGYAVYWFDSVSREHLVVHSPGSRLRNHTRALLAAFDSGQLFEWLRGEESHPVKIKRWYHGLL